MESNNIVNWFEIPVSDYERAINFYEQVFDTSLQRQNMDDCELAIFPMGGATVSGALIKGAQQPSRQGCLVYLNVEGIMDSVIERAQRQGSEILFPKTNIGEWGYIAHLSDSEGNKIALHSMSA